MVYVALGIDSQEHDQVIAVCASYDEAKCYCMKTINETEFFDLWIEKHPVL